MDEQTLDDYLREVSARLEAQHKVSLLALDSDMKQLYARVYEQITTCYKASGPYEAATKCAIEAFKPIQHYKTEEGKGEMELADEFTKCVGVCNKTMSAAGFTRESTGPWKMCIEKCSGEAIRRQTELQTRLKAAAKK
jgi:phage-related minor tail protein